MLIRELFSSDVTRNIPPVVYFHETSPEKLAAEVSEYIVTGGWPKEHPNHRRVPRGIHEEYVRLLTAIAAELDKPGGPDLPNAWISGFYGSGKSSFAKLLGLALDGVGLPDGTSLSEAWLRRDTSPLAPDLRKAWSLLRQKIEPIAVVFDVGGSARDDEHVHATALRKLQERLGYSRTAPLVADFELRLERDGEWHRFEKVAQEALGKPWSSVKDTQFAEDHFSLALSKLHPTLYPDPMSWIEARAGTHRRDESAAEAAAAIRDMLAFRRPGATLFFVIDEVLQYVVSDRDRTDRLRAFASELGATLRGKVWLLALGQQKIDEDAKDPVLAWAKDRFPPQLRVHLDAANIRDVIHRRLLHKKPEHEASLRALFERHRADLKLFAYGCDAITAEEFVEAYPMLPGQVDLILQLTTTLRARSSRAQGDDQTIRGLLQLLGELFRDRRLADDEVGRLVTLDEVYEVQQTALDSDVQASMARLLAQCADDASGLLVRAAKVVALLELIQETVATDAKLVAECLYDRIDRGNILPQVTEALEELRRRNLLGFSEKQGYKLQSSAAEEWARERRDLPVSRETISDRVKACLAHSMAEPERPKLMARPFPWAATYSDGRRSDDVPVLDPRDNAAFRVDFRYLAAEERTESAWVRKSAESALSERLVWVVGDSEGIDAKARELERSAVMARRYQLRRESLLPAQKVLLQQEEIRSEELESDLRKAVNAALMAGRLYFRGRSMNPQDHGTSFATALLSVGTRLLPEVFPQFAATQVSPAELMQLLNKDLIGPSTKFLPDDLGILELDSGQYVPACSGVIPERVRARIETDGGQSGAMLLSHFGRPPYGHPANVVKACVAGLLRAGKVRVQPEAGQEITSHRDAGVQDLFDRDRDFSKAMIFPAGEDDIGPPARARLCALFEKSILHGKRVERQDHAIADVVAQQFPELAGRLRRVQTCLDRLPGSPRGPAKLEALGEILDQCGRSCRQTTPTVRLLKRHFDGLNDGLELLQIYDAELTDEAVRDVRAAHDVLTMEAAQLAELGIEATNVEAATIRIRHHLSADRPWVALPDMATDLAEIRQAYAAERTRLMRWQAQAADQARAGVRGRAGFATLTADQSHHVLRPFASAVTATTPEAVAPSLLQLRDGFQLSLQRADEEANAILDAVLSEGDKPIVARVELGLRNRELSTEADVEALVSEIRQRLLEHVRNGQRVRLS